MRITVVSLLFAFATSAAAQDVVKVGHLGITADAPVYIAIEKGYFKERNIEVRLEPFVSAAIPRWPTRTTSCAAALAANANNRLTTLKRMAISPCDRV